MKLQIKFREDSSVGQRDEVVETLASKGATVRPVFPNTSDRKRGSFYIVEGDDEGADRLLGYLEQADGVEFVEPAVQRRLAR